MLRPAFIQIQQYRIAYYVSAGQGTPVLFIHSDSLSAQTFINLFNHALAQKYYFVALDLPGNGFSEWAKEPTKEYTLPVMATIIQKFAEALGLNNPVVVGHGLGGHLALELAANYPVNGLFIWGAPPLSKSVAFNTAYLPEPVIDLCNKPDLSPSEISILADKLLVNTTPLLHDFISRLIAQTDPAIRGILTIAFVTNNFTDELAIVKNLNVPLAIIYTQHDPFINITYLEDLLLPTLWQNSITFFPHAAHLPQLENPSFFTELLEKFMIDCKAV